MTIEAGPKKVNVADYAGKGYLLDTVRSERDGFYSLLNEAPWEGTTASGHWQVRDLCGHLIDVTEGYLDRFALAQRGDPFPEALGWRIMPQKLDENAQRFRELSKDQAIARLQSSSDRFLDVLNGLDEQQWSGLIVPHTYTGPLPAFIYGIFQVIDYSIHSWDIRHGLGRIEPLSDAAAGVLVPVMFVVLQNTLDPERAAGLDFSCGVQVSGPTGGSWCVKVSNNTVSYAEGPTDDCDAVLSFDPNEFVLTSYQRVRGGTVSGDAAVAEKFRGAFFTI
jgi:uncharacterized protein (TIGR03083 family)